MEGVRRFAGGGHLFLRLDSCPDFAVNTLGTCKHIEAMLLQLRKRYRKTLETAAYKRTRASLALQYGDTIEVRLHLPVSAAPALRSPAAQHFDPAGLLPRDQYRQFAQVLDAFRKADDRAIIYSDVLECVDRENELAEGVDLEAAQTAMLSGSGRFESLRAHHAILPPGSDSRNGLYRWSTTPTSLSARPEIGHTFCFADPLLRVHGLRLPEGRPSTAQYLLPTLPRRMSATMLRSPARASDLVVERPHITASRRAFCIIGNDLYRSPAGAIGTFPNPRS
jgi:hypothetical protein